MDFLATAEFGYESYEGAHGRMAFRWLMMSQSATPHKLLNDLQSTLDTLNFKGLSKICRVISCSR